MSRDVGLGVLNYCEEAMRTIIVTRWHKMNHDSRIVTVESCSILFVIKKKAEYVKEA